MLAGSSCTYFRLSDDLKEIRHTGLLTGHVDGAVAAEGPIYLFDFEGKTLKSVQKLNADFPDFALLAEAGSHHDLVAFQDADGDGALGAHERLGLLADLGGVHPTSREERQLPDLTLGDDHHGYGELKAPAHLKEARFSIGEVHKLSEPLFSEDRANEGMWTPGEAMNKGGYGIHFLEKFDPTRTPILFVHGINGSPRDFESIIEHLDLKKFQVWVVYYPTGIRLPVVTQVLFEQLHELHAELKFPRLTIVAHSMGGLVSRSVVLKLADHQETFVSTLVTISTPYGGHTAARSGLAFAPSAVPSWIDLAPGSTFLKTLRKPLPAGLHFSLFFTHGDRATVIGDNNDGVVRLDSELEPFAQDQAEHVHGFDLGHVEVLSDAKVRAHLYPLLDL